MQSTHSPRGANSSPHCHRPPYLREETVTRAWVCLEPVQVRATDHKSSMPRPPAKAFDPTLIDRLQLHRQELRGLSTLRTGLRKVSFFCRQTLVRTRKANTRSVSSPVLHRATILCREQDVTACLARGSYGHCRKAEPAWSPSARDQAVLPKGRGWCGRRG